MRPVPADGEAARSAGWRLSSTSARTVAIVLVGLVLLPMLAVVVARFGLSYTPAGDEGLIDLRVRDVFSSDVPLVGPYGNRGWSHPGPFLFSLLAIPSLLSGRAAWGTQVGAVLLQALAVVWLARLAWRRGGLPLLAAAMVGMSLVGHATTEYALRNPWNPYVVLPFFVLFVFQGWLLATGEARVLPGAAAVATLLVQSHVGYAPLVVAVAVVVVACRIVDARRGRAGGEDAREWRRPVWWAVAILAVLWLPPVIDVLVDWPGNLWAVGKYFVSPGGVELPRMGLEQAAEIVAAEFSPRPSWFFGPQPGALGFGVITRPVGWLLVAGALLGAGWWRSWRRRETATLRFVVLAATLLVVGLLAISRVDGTALEYQFLWRPAVAVAVVLGSGWALLAGNDHLRRWLPVGGIVAALVVVAASSGVLALGTYDVSSRDTPAEVATAHLAREARRHGIPDGGAILRLQESSFVQLQRGVYNELRRHGEDVSVDEHLAYQFPDGAGASPDDVERVWWVADSGAALTELTAIPGAELVASYSPLSPAREARARALQAQLFDELVRVGRSDLLTVLDSSLLEIVTRDVDGIDHDAAEELAAINRSLDRRDRLRGGIVSFAPADAPERLVSG